MRHWGRGVGFLMAVSLGAVAIGCGGGGSNGSSPQSELFVADIAHGAIAGFPDVNPPAGSTPTGRLITGISALGESLALDGQKGRLFATSGSNVVVFDGAGALAGNATPTRTITPARTAFVGPVSLFFDRAKDTVYVGGNTTSSGAVVAIGHASTASGVVDPDYVMTISSGVNFFTIDTTRSLLYVVNSLVGVHVFEGMDPSGAVTATGSFSFGTNPTSGLAIDPGRDRLYVADPFAGVHVVAGASSASGLQSTAAIAIPNAQFVTIDAASDRLYVGAYEKAYILNAASTLTNGSLLPSAVGGVAPAGSSIAGFAFP